MQWIFCVAPVAATAAVLCILIGAVLTFATPYALSHAIDQLSASTPDNQQRTLIVAALTVGGLGVLNTLISGLGTHVAGVANRTVSAHRVASIGALATKRNGVSPTLSQDALHWIQIDGPAYLYVTLQTLLNIIALGIVIALWRPVIGVACIILVITALLLVATAMGTYGSETSHQRSNATRAGQLWDIATGKAAQREIRVFDWRDWITGLYTDAASAAMQAAGRTNRKVTIFQLLAGLCILTSIALCTGLALFDAKQGRIDAGTLSSLCFAIVGMHVVGNTGHVINRTRTVVQHLTALVRAETTATSATSATSDAADVAIDGASASNPAQAGRIEFRNVWFRYPEQDDAAATTSEGDGTTNAAEAADAAASVASVDPTCVLRNLNLTITPGERIAVVGPNGAGKSTLAGLIAGHYQPNAGSIDVHGDVVLMQQYPTLFPGTVADNVSFTQTRDAIEHALTHTPGNRFIAGLPETIDTIIDPDLPGGRGLSGGQKQTLYIARAQILTPNSAVLILDEPASNLDLDAEMNLYDHVAGLKDLTTIVITHRLSAARRAERILVVDDGRIVEDGSHDELFAQRGLYYRLYTTQQQTRTGAMAPAPAKEQTEC